MIFLTLSQINENKKTTAKARKMNTLIGKSLGNLGSKEQNKTTCENKK
jgi:hypothetical protein